MAKKQTDNLVKNPSFFRHLGDRMPKEIGWDEVYRLVREDGQVENNTNRYRDCVMQDDNKGAERWKAASGAITPCACCEGGHAMANLVRFTSIGMVDLDDVSDDRLPEVMAKVKGDEHTFMAWVTTSGHGVRVLFRYSFSQAPADGPAPTFADAFRRGNDYYARLTEVSVDEHVKDATRLSFLAHDAEAVWNPDATPFTVRPLDITERSIQEVEERGLRYVEGSRNAYISSVSYLLNRYGMSEPEAVEWAKRRFPDYEGTEGVVRSCYKQTDEHGTRSVGRTRKTDDDAAANRKTKYALKPDIKVYLSGQGEYRRNLVTGDVEYRLYDNPCKSADDVGEGWAILTDSVANSLAVHMSEDVKECRVADVWTVVRSDFAKGYNPFIDYANSLPEWKEGDPDYIGELAARITTTDKPEVFDLCFRKWLVAMFASWIDVHIVNHEVLTLIGGQGFYKTTFFKNLLPTAWQDRYFALKLTPTFSDKDSLLKIGHLALILIEEIDTMTARETDSFKAAVTAPSIRERVPYGHGEETFPHIASFAATGNKVEYLTDPTGNRRWLTFEVTDIVDPFTTPVNHEGLYAQAKYLYESGFTYWFNRDDIALIEERNRRYTVPSMEEELISKYYRLPEPGEPVLYQTATDIVEYITSFGVKKLTNARVGIALRKLGYKKIARKQKYVYATVRLSMEEIDAMQRETSVPQPF